MPINSMIRYNFHMIDGIHTGGQVSGADRVEVANLCLDANYDNQIVTDGSLPWPGKPECNISCIYLSGVDANVTNVKAIHFGVGWHDGKWEQFTIFVGGTYGVSNNKIVGCEITSPALNTSGVQTMNGITAGHTILTGQPAYALSSGIIIENNNIHDFPNPPAGLNGISFGQTTGAIVRNNTVNNFKGACYYNDSFSNTFALFHGNNFVNVSRGFVFSAEQWISNPAQRPVLQDYEIRNNTIRLDNTIEATAFMFIGPDPVYRSRIDRFMIKWNNIYLHAYNPNARPSVLIFRDTRPLVNASGAESVLFKWNNIHFTTWYNGWVDYGAIHLQNENFYESGQPAMWGSRFVEIEGNASLHSGGWVYTPVGLYTSGGSYYQTAQPYDPL
jgi:hypothetical protein